MVILAVTSGHTVPLVQLMPVPVHPGLAPALVPTTLPRCCLLETTITVIQPMTTLLVAIALLLAHFFL